MYKRLSITLIATTLLLGIASNSKPILAGTCASKCGPHPIQFTPGQLVKLEVVNKTPRVLKIQRIAATETIFLQPGQQLQLDQTQVTQPNMSLIFWDDTGRALKAVVSQPNFATLRVELHPDWYPPGNRSVYVREDGQVNIF